MILPVTARRIGNLACVLVAFAAPVVSHATGCEVLTSGMLETHDYIASYSGGCKNGRAEGQGTAQWTRRYAPDVAPIVWQGRFVDGIYLGGAEVRGARRLNSSDVLLDLGPLAGPGRQRGHLWVKSRAHDTQPALVCRPNSVHVNTQGPLHDDAVARGWLDAAYQRWQGICRENLPPPGPVPPLQVYLHEGSDWMKEYDGRRSLPGIAVSANTALGTSTPPATADWRGYRNAPAQARASALQQQARVAELQARLQANQKRLHDFARSVHARRFVSLDALQQNPFRFGDDILLVDVRLREARTPTLGVIHGSTRSAVREALLQGDIAQWDDTPRIVAVRVQGRSTESRSEGVLVLELIDSRVCEERNCDEFLLISEQGRMQEFVLE